jgi:hypothetical protein
LPYSSRTPITHSTQNIQHLPRRLGVQQDAQKGRTSHPPSPGAPRRAVPQARPQRAVTLKGWGGMIPTARVFPIPHFNFKGGLVDPRMRASNEHILLVRVPRAGGRPGYPSHPSEAARCASTGIVPATHPHFFSTLLSQRAILRACSQEQISLHGRRDGALSARPGHASRRMKRSSTQSAGIGQNAPR